MVEQLLRRVPCSAFLPPRCFYLYVRRYLYPQAEGAARKFVMSPTVLGLFGVCLVFI